MLRPLKFNAKDESTIIELKNIYKGYRKITGYAKTIQYGLAGASEGFVYYDDKCDLSDFLNDTGYSTVLCRADAPFGKDIDLPRGRELHIYDLKSYFKEARAKCKESVVLAVKIPTLDIYGCYLPRYKTSGGILIIIDFQQRIRIEYVGNGFDVGDISRGRAIHYGIEIPWDIVFEKPGKIYSFTRICNLHYWITQNEYMHSVSYRIRQMADFGYDINDVKLSIPYKPSTIKYWLFKKIYDECIFKLLCSNFQDRRSYSVLINLYGEHLYVFEVNETGGSFDPLFKAGNKTILLSETD